MDSDFSASTATDTSAVAPVSDGSASASSTDTTSAAVAPTAATPEAAPAAVQDATAPDTAAPSIDAGWTLDDEQPSTLVPDNDDDLNALTNEPGLDQAKVPGLVQAIKDARAAVKSRSAETAQLREQYTQLQAAFEPYGGVDGAKTYLDAFKNLLTAPQAEHGAAPFLAQLYDQAYPVYERLVGDVIQHNADYALNVLKEAGKLPDAAVSTAAGVFTADDLAAIPDHLRGIAQQLPAAVQEDLLQQPEEARNFHLERELKLSQLDERERQQVQRDFQQRQTAAQRQGQQAVIDLTTQYEQANLQILSKWQPYGPENAQANTRLHGEVMEGAMAELLRDKQYAQMYQDSQALLAQAPLRRLRQDTLGAEQDERMARQYAARVNTRLGQLIRERVQERESVYSDARKWREYQQTQIQSRTEISGPASQAQGSNGIRTLDANGKISREYIDHLARTYGQPA